MSKLLIVGQKKERLNQIKNDLDPLSEVSKGLKISISNPSLLSGVLDHTYKVLIFDVKLITRMFFPQIVKIRKLGFYGPILLLGEKSSEFSLEEMAANKNINLLQPPYSTEQLQGLVKNCLLIEQIKQRRDQRFDVKEVATLQAYKSDYQAQTTICNISRTGVRIEGNMMGLEKGDLLRLHFYFEKIKKERTMSARVVWKKEDEEHIGEAGLEFVSQKAVYKYLLEGAAA